MRKKLLLRASSGLLAALFLLLPAAGQSFAADSFPGGTSTPSGRPKVGLVLSGGGARGAAHIGVIRVLEEMRIPIDYIGGTSMGSIVGGFYAAGMNPDELEEILLTLDWDAAFRDRPKREDLNFRRKEDGDDYPISLQLGIRDWKLKMPKGLLQGQNLNAILASLTLPVATVDDFDDLHIPFRAVAADIETGEKYVFTGGSLAEAMRASMSIPGVFAPVEIGGKILVDGGIARNLPVDVVREMGADVVIAVDISTPLAKKENLQSALSITAQLSTILTRRNTERQIASLEEKDILIVPPLGKMSAGDFAGAGKAVPIGEDAAREAAGRLRRYSVSEDEFQRYLARQRAGERTPPRIDFVQVETDSNLAPEVISADLHVQPGQELDFGKLKEDIDKIYGTGLFERIDSSIVERDGRTGLLVKTVRKSWGPNYLVFGLELESDLDGGSNFNFSTRLTATEINRWGGEWRTDLQVGERPRLLTEFYQPLGAYSDYFIAPRLELEEFTTLLFIGDTPISNYRVARRAVAFDIGRSFDTWGEMRLGYFREKADAEAKIGGVVGALLEENVGLPLGLQTLGNQKFDTGALEARFAYDTYDSVNFPKRGAKGDLRFLLARESLGSDDSFDSVGGRLSKAFTRDWNTLVLFGQGGTVLDGRAAIQNTFSLGGLFRLSGLTKDQLRGQHSLFGALALYRQFWGRSAAPPNLPVYLGLSLEAGNVWQDSDDITFSSLIPAGSAFLGLDTILGPVYVAYGVAEGGHDAFYFFLGRGF